MAKEITCKVEKVFCTTDKTEYGDTRLAEISWNGKKITGVDIRKYDKARDSMYKGITVSYNGLTDIVSAAIENGLVDIETVEKAITKRKKVVYSDDDFQRLFHRVTEEQSKYTRDKYGILRDDDGRRVITGRRKK